MRIVHPGCDQSSRGRGYNSGGTFCEGWAGNCGEGGKGASSWYLMCTMCREKYLYLNRNVNNVNSAKAKAEAAAAVAAGKDIDAEHSAGNSPANLASTTSTALAMAASKMASAASTTSTMAAATNSGPHSDHLFDTLFGIKSSQIVNSEVYTMMRENSMFLLELSASSPAVTLNTANGSAPQKRSSTAVADMHLVQQQQHQIDQQRPGTSRGLPGDSPLNRNAHHQQHNHRRTSTASSYYNGRRSDAAPANLLAAASPELLWQAPESFACLESLGASVQAQQTQYTIFDLNSAANDFERPLSEVSVDSMGGGGAGSAADRGLIAGSSASVANNIGSLARFHRSMSMGQGWPSTAIHGRYVPGLADTGGPESGVTKVVMRRRQQHHQHMDDGGSLLLCHPSENLRRLVPDSLLSAPLARPPRSAHDGGDLPFTRQPTGQDGNTDASAGETLAMAADAMEPNVSLLTRPVMIFILERHNLDRLRYSLKRNLRVSTCRIYALQSLNWLMRSVTQPTCLHDLMWWFAGSLKPSGGGSGPIAAMLADNGDEVAAVGAATKQTDDQYAGLALDHPITSNQMCGRITQLLTQSFHAYLQTVADLTLLLPAGSALQQCAIQCFGIRFRQSDHQFLHRSHVFGNISKILSRSDERENQDNNDQLQLLQSHVEPPPPPPPCSGTRVISLADVTGHFDLIVSSRPAMAVSLTDGSTETFWESDEEDRNKAKVLELVQQHPGARCRLLCVHIDNSRDIQNRVNALAFYGGTALGDATLIRQQEVDVAATTGAWFTASIRDATHTHFRVELRGSEATLRVRQVRLLGDIDRATAAVASAAATASNNAGGPQRSLPSAAALLLSNARQCNAAHIQQRNCESETLRVFRLITAQVFGKLILNANSQAGEAPAGAGACAFSRSATAAGLLEASQQSNTSLADSLDLREHMVGILFSRSKLSHLQKQVIVHIVHAIRKETQRAKDDWEMLNAPTVDRGPPTAAASAESPAAASSSQRAPDTYCFEMLSMVLALSGSPVGRAYLSQQHGLLKDLLSLLHTGSDRVQRQVTALLRRMLPEIVPETLGDLLGVYRMPPADFSIAGAAADEPAFDMNRMGILDIFLAVIAKSLQLQTKVKTNGGSAGDGYGLPKPTGPPPSLRLGTTIDLNVCAMVESADGYDPINEPHLIPPKTASEVAEERLYDFGHGSHVRSNANEYHALYRRTKEHQRNLNQRWFFRGTISAKQAENIIALIRDMSAGKFSDRWQRVTKAAIAEAIVNLTRLGEVFR